MDWAEFLSTTIGNVVATIPALAVLASPLIYGLNKIRLVTKEFPQSVDDTKEILTNRFNDSKDQLRDILNVSTEKLQEKVNGSLLMMKDQLATYQEQLISTKDQANLLVQQNKVYMDTIAELTGLDPHLVQNGVASKLSLKLNMTKDELMQFPEKIMSDYNLLEKALVEAKNILGEDAYKKLLEKVNEKKV